MSHDETWPADIPRAGHAHRIDVLARTLREMDVQVALPDPQPWEGDEEDQDPLSLESLGAQTRRLVLLIERAREQKDALLVYSLRRELLLTRWALVKSHSARARARPRNRRCRVGKILGAPGLIRELGSNTTAGGPRGVQPPRPMPPP